MGLLAFRASRILWVKKVPNIARMSVNNMAIAAMDLALVFINLVPRKIKRATMEIIAPSIPALDVVRMSAKKIMDDVPAKTSLGFFNL